MGGSVGVGGSGVTVGGRGVTVDGGRVAVGDEPGPQPLTATAREIAERNKSKSLFILFFGLDGRATSNVSSWHNCHRLLDAALLKPAALM